ncbi:MAG: Mur ligase domain-containing protein, partial [Trueperaceae bacterium]
MSTIHFVGVGGVSMQALALWCRHEGFEVSGCDSGTFDDARLRRAGIEVCTGHDPAHAHGVSLVVHSMAVPADHPELVAARAAGARVLRRIELLGELFGRRRAIGISGTHGKSTTTGMAATLLLALDPDTSVQLGASLPAIEGGYRYGTGEWLVAEVDESDPGFADLHSGVAVLTNLDEDHVAGDFEERRNYYGSYDDLKAAALKFASSGERLVYCHDWPSLTELVAHLPQAVSFGLQEGADYRVTDIALAGSGSTFVITGPGLPATTVRLAVPGRYNVYNAAGAIAAVHQAGYDPRPALPALEAFLGVGRRWQVWGERQGALIVDDYAHHPTEVAAILEAARGTGRRVRAVLQPHRWIR